MWRQVALPVILVALSWLVVSGSTNFYLQWLDDSYQQVFDENISSMHAASLVQQEIWRLHAEVIARWNREDDWSARLKEFDSEMKAPLATLVERSSTSDELSIARQIDDLTARYRDQLQAALADGEKSSAASAATQDILFSLAVQISEKSDRIREINDVLLRSSNQRRAQISQVVLWARGIAITLVPALGIAAGWWTAARLQKSVARIQVTLHDPSL